MQIEAIGPYRIKEHLGSGGMGSVYLAWDERLQRRVAIKSIHPAKEKSATRVERLRREAQAVASVNHPAITQVYDILSEDDCDFIVMELVDGKALTEVIADAPIACAHAADIGRQIAEGLSAAHEKGVIHRDLKAENVMVGPSGRVKILDFGLAKVIAENRENESLTEDGVVMGTSSSMSPEQAHGREVDGRSDLFALGTLLYQLLTGKHPFQGRNQLDTMRRIAKHRPESPRSLNQEVPLELSLLVQSLLEKDRKKRPTTAKEVAIALAPFSDGDSTKTTSISDLTRITSQALRRQIVRQSWPFVAGLVVLLIAIILGWRWVANANPLPPVAVAVLKPTVVSETEQQRADVFTHTLRMAMLNGIAALEGLQAIDSRTIDQVGEDPEEISKAVAADEMLVADCSLVRETWQVTIQRLRCDLDSGAHHLTWSSSLELREGDLGLLGGAIAAKLRECYPSNNPLEGRFISTASSQDYADYMRIRNEISAGQDYKKAFELLKELRTRSPRFLEAMLSEVRLGRYLGYFSDREYYLARARAALHDAQRIAPEDPRVLRTSAELALATKDLDTVRHTIERTRIISPSEFWLLGYEAELARLEGNLESARGLLVEQVQRRTTYHTLFQLAEFDFHHGRPGLAIPNLEQALELAPRHRGVRAKLAEVELFHGDLHRSEELLTGLVEEFGSPSDLADLSVAQMLLGDYEGTITSCQRALELDPDFELSLLNLADAFALIGDHSNATYWYQQALESTENASNPDDAGVLTTRSQCLAHLGRKKEAAAVIQRRLQLASEDMISHFDAALVYAVIGEHSSAVVSAQRAVDLGLDTRWFRLPWFEPLHTDPDFVALLGVE